MIIILILVIVFIGMVLHLSFANEEPEVKIAGLTFFLSLFLVGPFFSGIISIHAPVPMDSENRIELVSIAVALVMTGIAVGIYKVVEEIKYRTRERKRAKKKKHKGNYKAKGTERRSLH